MTPVIGRVVLSDPATLHGAVGPIMLELHADGTTSWRPIYQSTKGRKFAPKPEALLPRQRPEIEGDQRSERTNK